MITEVKLFLMYVSTMPSKRLHYKHVVQLVSNKKHIRGVIYYLDLTFVRLDF